MATREDSSSARGPRLVWGRLSSPHRQRCRALIRGSARCDDGWWRKPEEVYRPYAIVDEAMMREGETAPKNAGSKLSKDDCTIDCTLEAVERRRAKLLGISAR